MRRKSGSSTLYNFQTYTISHPNMILTTIVFILEMNIVHIISEIMGSSYIRMPLIIIMLIVCNNHGLRLVCSSLLVLIRKIKSMIALSSNMSWFETYLTCNRIWWTMIMGVETTTMSSATIDTITMVGMLKISSQARKWLVLLLRVLGSHVYSSSSLKGLIVVIKSWLIY